MPIHILQDKNGYYCQWGNSGKKYYFNKFSQNSFESALRKAQLQARAAYSHGYKRK
jgi:hypothetical protein